jgi:hypothetical protein
MRRLLLLVALFAASVVTAADAKIHKLLPHLLDAQGRISRSPSLYERDAYQAWLRTHPESVSGLRFDVNWKARRTAGTAWVLRLELRTTQRAGGQPLVLETPVKAPNWGSRWTSLTLAGEDWRKEGDVTAWRATLLAEGKEVATSQSFLW